MFEILAIVILNLFVICNLDFEIYNYGAEGENRTHDTMIFSHLLYH